MTDDDDVLTEKRIELRQKLKSQLLTLSPSYHILNSFNNFIPNSRDTDFIEKQGLDCVMNYLIYNSAMEFNEQMPNICTNCRIDSAENWWHSSLDNKTFIVLCDQCEQNRIKNAILEQHRQSMKLAFLQAKEIESRLEVDYQKQRSIKD